jgi:hypothetical protein
VSGSAPALTVTTNPGTFTMPASDVELRAEFKLKTYPIEVVNDGLGSVSADAEESPADATVKLTAVTPDDYTFVRWTVESGGVTLADATANPATFTMPREAVKFKAHFALIPRPPYILHLTANGRLAAGQWNDGTTGSVIQDNILYFKQGALVGFTTPSSLADETSWYSAFPKTTFYNPSDKPTSTFSSYYKTVPQYDYTTGEKDISTDAYNTHDGMKAGYGDPCRLIGLTAAEAQAMAAAGTLTTYNSGFRSPKRAEVIANWANKNSTTWTTINGRGGRWLNSEPNVTSFLPAAGDRSAAPIKEGAVEDVGVAGGWWTANVSYGAYVVYFTDTGSEVSDAPDKYGFSVRCLKK